MHMSQSLLKSILNPPPLHRHAKPPLRRQKPPARRGRREVLLSRFRGVIARRAAQRRRPLAPRVFIARGEDARPLVRVDHAEGEAVAFILRSFDLAAD